MFSKITKIVAIIATVLTIQSCSKSSDSVVPSPTAGFTFTSSGSVAPKTVIFTNTSTNATSYSWNFGDNATSTVASPTHVFTTSGTYTVTLTATNSSGSNTSSQVVNVGVAAQPPVANFVYSGANVAAPALVTFTNISTNATSYSWDFGDNYVSTVASPRHNYMAGGTYTVRLIATGAGGSNTFTETVNISPAYTKVFISKITLSQIPLIKPDGSSWNLLGGAPNVYVNIEDSTANGIKWNGSASVINKVTQAMLPISYTTTYNPTLALIGTRYVTLYNKDITSSTQMGYIGFVLSDYTTLPNPYPSTITINNSTYGIAATLNLVWQ